MRLSFTGMDRPRDFRRARSEAQTDAVRASRSRTRIFCTPTWNHDSSRLRRDPAGSRRIPYSISPSTTGFTARAASFLEIQSSTFGSGFGRMTSLRTFASTRNFIGSRLILRGWSETNLIRGKIGAIPRSLHWGERRFFLAGRPHHLRVPWRTAGRGGCYRLSETQRERRFALW
jgi:hypothetical protein